MLRVGVIGCGTIAQLAHLPALSMTSAAKAVALCDPRPKLLAAVAKRYGVRRTYGSAGDLLADHQVEAVILCVPTGQHHVLALQALRAGKPVLVEKPMATSVARAEEMLTAQQQSRGRVMVGHHKRYDAGCELAWQRLHEGELGPPQLVTYHWSCGDWMGMSPQGLVPTDEASTGFGYEYPAGVSAPEARTAYELHLEMLTHMTNLIRWLVGDMRGVLHAVPATGHLRGLALYSHGPFISQCTEGPHYETEPVWRERVEVWCEAGRVTVDLPPNILVNKAAEVRVWRADGAVEERLDTPWSWAFRRQIEHFAHCLATGEPFRTSGEDCLKDIALAEAAARLVQVAAAGA